MISTPTAKHKDTIIALATPPGAGAIAVIRLSGTEAVRLTNEAFAGKNLEQQPSHTLHFGTIRHEGQILDEVVVSLYKAPASYTKEDVIEISCHGSDFIVQQIIKLFLAKGARLAEAGEFTLRAFLNGRFDLAQAEAVADLIASDSALSHEVAMKNMRGGFSGLIKKLREELIHFASLIELELDFGEEDVEFADREALARLVEQLLAAIKPLLESFAAGNAIKSGVAAAIIGKPNAGKSTLLNALLNEERAIVSDIAGTTRDMIEDTVVIDGLLFRFADTAGIRETDDAIEKIGVERALQQAGKSAIIIYLFDSAQTSPAEVATELQKLQQYNVPILPVANKIDKADAETLAAWNKNYPAMAAISASAGIGIEQLKQQLVTLVLQNKNTGTGVIVTNMRHYEALDQTKQALQQVLAGLNSNITGDFVAADIRRSLYYLGQITGEITTNDLLTNIFSKFCIGK